MKFGLSNFPREVTIIIGMPITHFRADGSGCDGRSIVGSVVAVSGVRGEHKVPLEGRSE